jgi:predicted GTPase
MVSRLPQAIQAVFGRELDQQTQQDIQAELEQRIKAEPPIRIALIGLTGVGKSSTINVLFHAGAPVSHTRACTEKADEYETEYMEFPTSKGRNIHVFDMPGLGEDIEKDESHIEIYSRVLPDVDVALWIVSAINRAIRPVQEFLRDYGHLTPNLVIGVNKVDLMPPGAEAWNKKFNLPSPEQEQNIKGREEDIREKLGRWDWDGEVVAYSAEKHYQLPELLHQMLRAASEKRRWVLEQSTEVAPFEDLVDDTVLQKARALAGV